MEEKEGGCDVEWNGVGVGGLGNWQKGKRKEEDTREEVGCWISRISAGDESGGCDVERKEVGVLRVAEEAEGRRGVRVFQERKGHGEE